MFCHDFKPPFPQPHLSSHVRMDDLLLILSHQLPQRENKGHPKGTRHPVLSILVPSAMPELART